MSVSLSELKPGTVAIDLSGSICVITGMCPDRPVWPVIYVRQKASRTSYKGRPESFKAVVGHVDLEAFQGVLEAAKAEVASAEPLFGCPDTMKGLQIGDKVRIQHGSRVVEGEYGGYNHNRPKYPVSYMVCGKKWKGSVSSILGKA